MNPRFEKFVETQLNIYYGQNVYGTIDYEDKVLKEQYENLLQDFKKNLNISYLIDRDEQVLEYIVDNECINEEDVPEFIIFARVILERLYTIIETYKTTEKKMTIDLTKKQIKEREQEAKRLVREQKEQERLAERNREKEIKQQIREQKEHEKLKEKEIKQSSRIETIEKKQIERQQEKELERQRKEQLDIERRTNNNKVIKCECGLEYLFMNTRNHSISQQHIYRLEGIRWLLSEQSKG